MIEKNNNSIFFPTVHQIEPSDVFNKCYLLKKFVKKSIKEMIIIEMSWENNDVNVLDLYNKIESCHIHKKLGFLKN